MKLQSCVSAGWLALVVTQANFPVALNSTFGITGSRNIRIDTGTYGPPVEEVHYFYDQWPIGLAVSKTGRIFTCYTRGTYAYTLGEVVNETAEAAYPNLEWNTPLQGLYTSSNGITFGSNDASHFVSVQALYVTPDDTLWVLDTGRPTINQSQRISMPYAIPGGPKLVAVNLTTNSISKTYTLPETVHYPDSYMNDLRFDLRPNATESGGGIAYIVDSSNEGRNGFIMIDLATGESWRQLNQHPSTQVVPEDVPSYQGIPFYLRQNGHPLGFQEEGLDGAELDQYGEVMYYSALTTDYLYSIETKYLRINPNSNPLANKDASDNVRNLGQRGGNANGFTGDSLGNVYMLMPEHNAIYSYNYSTRTTLPYIRDPRIVWPDSANVGWDGYVYFTINQLPYQPDWNNGVDGRVHPGLILRSKLPDGASKNVLLM
ncbi:major royal jelly protein-domain-containing protein [Hypoxylon trugodes]|uniref:major royal jelly protein-domain-containing protein n=1 Tax=Hypoxylon trugodes TaxID=326681 RepID=UPI00219AE108|nr:major royal jelly protein-domain-containing protein [Hypoxylon trugodes]KAI1383731.1 major royal jelly protein-domain-containing protein [Hypoxylon trugodes]